MDLLSHLPRFQSKLSEIERELSQSTAFANPQKASELGREHFRIKGVLDTFSRYQQVQKHIVENEKLKLEHKNEAEMLQFIAADVSELQSQEAALELELKVAILPPDPNDSRSTILEIRAGTGGDEAALFAGDLFRMYSKYAEALGWKVEPIDSNPATLGGYREIIASVQGPNVFRYLRYESGVHRVQRIPATEANGRIHTSTATVAVLPEAEEVDIEIRTEDLEITVCRASGPGGQGVNTTDSAVQVTHKPSGLIVRCADERSQLKNKAKALRVLRSRLLTQKQDEEAAKYAQVRKSQIGTGDRSERIRTYNFPQNRVTDHRINVTLYNLSEFIDGKIDPLIRELMAKDYEEKLQGMSGKSV
jgi:peptide chain release factor 1